LYCNQKKNTKAKDKENSYSRASPGTYRPISVSDFFVNNKQGILKILFFTPVIYPKKGFIKLSANSTDHLEFFIHYLGASLVHAGQDVLCSRFSYHWSPGANRLYCSLIKGNNEN